MKSQGEIEAAICEGISRFEQDYMGRGPKDIHAHLIRNLIVVRLEGVLTAAEQHQVTRHLCYPNVSTNIVVSYVDPPQRLRA